MPALPSSLPSTPSFLPSPAVALGCFISVFVVVTIIYAFHGYVSRQLAPRRERAQDNENHGTNSTVIVNFKGKDRPCPEETLKAARKQLKIKVDAISLHKTLMAHTNVVPKVDGVAVPPAVFLAKREVVKASPGRYTLSQQRRPLGASPLRAVFSPAPPIVIEPAPLKPPVPIIKVTPPPSSTTIGPSVPAGAPPFNPVFDYDSESQYSEDDESFNLDDFPMPPMFIPAAVAPRAPALTKSKNAGRAVPLSLPKRGRPSKRTVQNKENYPV